jgi:DNA-binding NarL/FixJ family response regulator
LEGLTIRQQRAALAFLRDAYRARDFDQFVAFVLVTLPTLVRSEVTSYNEMRPAERYSRNWVNPESLMVPERDEAWANVMHEHPILAHHERCQSSAVVKLSDFLSSRQLHNLGLYSEHYGPLGRIEDSLNILLTSDGTISGIGLHRASKYTDREQALLEFLRLHLIQARANSLALTKMEREASRLAKVLDASARALVVLKRDRTIDFATESARGWMREYFDDARGPDRLPEVLDLWIRQHDSAVRQILELPKPRGPLVVNRKDRRLVARLLSGDEEILLLLEEQTTSIARAALSSLGLTPREAEVLAHMANGLSKARIAQLLGMSPRTVDAHVQNIMQSLGVSSSTAATAKAFQASTIGYHKLPNEEDAALSERLIRSTTRASERWLKLTVS